MADISLQVNGREFKGWKSVRVTLSLEAVAGSFELEVSEKWANQSQPWPIAEEDECTVKVAGKTVITGYVERRRLSFSADSHTLNVAGRDRTGELVDCSAVLDRWEFLKTPVAAFAEKICAPFGISSSLQAGVAVPSTPAKLSVDPGDRAFDALERACRMAGVLPVSDGKGGLLLTRPGSSRTATQLVQGVNVLAASAEFDATARFSEYLVLGQQRDLDGDGKTSAHIRASAKDANVKRTHRKLLVRPEGSVSIEHAKTRAQWEASVRAARGDAVSVTVQGWTQGNGELWPVNALTQVRCPFIGVDGEMLISEVTFSADEGRGTVTDLTLRRPEAFKPEPLVTKDTEGPNAWKELKGGV